MGDLIQDTDDFGKEVQAKRAAEREAKEKTQKAAVEAEKQEKQHEEDKREGMI